MKRLQKMKEKKKGGKEGKTEDGQIMDEYERKIKKEWK